MRDHDTFDADCILNLFLHLLRPRPAQLRSDLDTVDGSPGVANDFDKRRKVRLSQLFGKRTRVAFSRETAGLNDPGGKIVRCIRSIKLGFASSCG